MVRCVGVSILSLRLFDCFLASRRSLVVSHMFNPIELVEGSNSVNLLVPLRRLEAKGLSFVTLDVV